jgi:hypothetical protein
MNLKKALYILLALALTVQLGFGQVKEEAFYTVQPDPIKSIQVYPNPATEFVSVKFEAPQAKKVKLTIHNILGNTMDLETEIVDEHEIKIRVKDITSGYYFVSVSDAGLNSKVTCFGYFSDSLLESI